MPIAGLSNLDYQRLSAVKVSPAVSPSFSLWSLWLRAWLTRVCVRLAWRCLVGSQRYITLSDLVIDNGSGPIHIGTVLVSTRGVFVIETWHSERGGAAVTRYEDSIRYCDERARLVAEALEEDRCLVSPVVVFAGESHLPEERPANVVSELGLVQYIGSFKADVFSAERLQAIAERLGRLPAPSAQAA